MKFTGAIVFVVALLTSLVSIPTFAGTGPVQHIPHRVALIGDFRGGPQFERVQKKNGVSRDQAAALVKRKYGGKILAIQEVNRDGRSMYRVKGLSEKSQVYVVYVDKQSGRISR